VVEPNKNRTARRRALESPPLQSDSVAAAGLGLGALAKQSFHDLAYWSSSLTVPAPPASGDIIDRRMAVIQAIRHKRR